MRLKALKAVFRNENVSHILISRSQTTDFRSTAIFLFYLNIGYWFITMCEDDHLEWMLGSRCLAGCDKTACRAADGCGWRRRGGRWQSGCVSRQRHTQTDTHLMHPDIGGGVTDNQSSISTLRLAKHEPQESRYLDLNTRQERGQGMMGSSARFQGKMLSDWVVRAGVHQAWVMEGKLKRSRFGTNKTAG